MSHKDFRFKCLQQERISAEKTAVRPHYLKIKLRESHIRQSFDGLPSLFTESKEDGQLPFGYQDVPVHPARNYFRSRPGLDIHDR
jgi:hypothetical protein